MRVSFRIHLIAVLGLSIATTSRAFESQPIAITANGTLVGIRNSHYDQDFFLGVPYAQPPMGHLRYNHPQPVNQSWSRRPVTAYGPWCHSAPLNLPGFSQTGFPHNESEDCLTLNVVRPSKAHRNLNLPVLVWIYGGGFQEGGSADQRYNMSFLVRESVKMGSPIIGVSFNYRLSGFGFLPGRAVGESGTANLGLYDQRLALHWVKENIAAFGGDPSRVTISGESAGACSVGQHFLAYSGRDDGLFRAGIAESGGPVNSSPFLSLDEQDVLYDGVLNKTECDTAVDTLECLRSTDVETLKAAFQGGLFTPVIDGDMIPNYPSVSLQEGRFVRRPILIGANTNEGTSIAASVGGLGINGSADFRTLIARLWPGIANATIEIIADEYLNNLSEEEVEEGLGTVMPSPGPEYGALYGRVTLWQGDVMFISGRRHAAEVWSQHGVPAYSYCFDTVPNGIDPGILGVTHFQEVPYMFRNYDGVGFAINRLASNFTDVRQGRHAVSNLMSRMWISFTNEMSPNAHQGN
ncbi:hypothetical protein PSPO01_15266 [Paraphaeosphaeria sporulosa]